MTNMKISGIYNTYINARDKEINQLNNQLAFSKQELQSTFSMIKDILYTDQLENKKNSLIESPLYIPELLDDIQLITQKDVSEHQIDLSIEYQNIINKNVISDSLRLQQILLNVLEYTIDFAPIGSKISLYVIEKPSPLTGYTDYEFRIVNKALTPLSTINEPTDSSLRILIAKSLVDMMGGTITINTSEDVGSEFIISLCLKISNLTTTDQ